MSIGKREYHCPETTQKAEVSEYYLIDWKVWKVWICRRARVNRRSAATDRPPTAMTADPTAVFFEIYLRSNPACRLPKSCHRSCFDVNFRRATPVAA